MKANTKRLQSILEKSDIDVAIVSSPENLFYVADIPTTPTSWNRLLFCVRKTAPVFCVISQSLSEPSLILSASALEAISKSTWVKDLRLYYSGTYIRRSKPLSLSGGSAGETLLKVVKEKIGVPQRGKRKKIRLGIELNDFSAENYLLLAKNFPHAEIVDATPELMESRMVKNDEEIARFRKATEIMCRAMKKVEDACKDRPTERELDIVLKTSIMNNGAESWHQTTIAAGKVSGADISNQPVPDRKIAPGDVIRLDASCVYKGYCADLSRTYAVETIPPRAAKAYKVIRHAYFTCMPELIPGTPASKINKLAVDYVRKHLDKDYVRGYVGHGVGVDVYDRPFLSEKDHTPLAPRMTLSYEVPYHMAGFAGLNLEDSILITEKGHEIVSSYESDIIVV